jgi:hypothetical protein
MLAQRLQPLGLGMAGAGVGNKNWQDRPLIRLCIKLLSLGGLKPNTCKECTS